MATLVAIAKPILVLPDVGAALGVVLIGAAFVLAVLAIVGIAVRSR